jgi:hypothetical protein
MTLLPNIALCLLAGAFITGCGSDSGIGNVLSGGDFNGASARQLELAKQSRRELCCSITIVEYTETSGVVNGCGQQATYAYTNTAWVKQSEVAITNWGSSADRLPNCNQ